MKARDTESSARLMRYLLLALCLALGACAVLCFINTAWVLRRLPQEDEVSHATLYVIGASILDVVLLALTIVYGLRLARRTEGDTRDLVNTCQSFAIAAAGTCIVDWLVDVLSVDVMHRDGVTTTGFTLVIIAAYYLVVKRLRRSSFWDGVRFEEHGRPLVPMEDITTHLALDAASGLLMPVHDGEDAAVVILGVSEYLEGLPDRVAQQVMRLLRNVRRCSYISLGDVLVGNVLIPLEVLRAVGMEATEVITFSFQIDSDRLVFVMDEGTPARSLMGMYLSDQYLAKDTPMAVIPELIDMIAMGMSGWLEDYEARLALLEDKLDKEQYEQPQGFYEFVSAARGELYEVQGFCRQMKGVLDELAELRGSQEASLMCAAVSRHLEDLATVTGETRDLAGDIRSEFQERINVRQDDVISMLTIVTTVFTPLSLVAGWYGMNFMNMPELWMSDAYFVLATIMAMIIAFEFAYFKHRRWF